MECPVGASRQDERPVVWPSVQGLCSGPAELTLGECWRVLAQPSDRTEPQQTQRIGQDLAAGDLDHQLCLLSRHWSHRAMTRKGQPPECLGAACELLSTTSTCLTFYHSTEIPALHQDALQGEGIGLPGFQTWSLKCGKAWKIGPRAR